MFPVQTILKGTKLLVVAVGQGIPVPVATASETSAEVKLIEQILITVPLPKDRAIPLVADRASDSYALRERLAMDRSDLLRPIDEIEK
jgi:hypothetical protein